MYHRVAYLYTGRPLGRAFFLEWCFTAGRWQDILAAKHYYYGYLIQVLVRVQSYQSKYDHTAVRLVSCHNVHTQQYGAALI